MKSFFIKTYGCSNNQADSIIMRKLLEKKDFKEAENEGSADIIIVNTCAVKQPTQSKILRYINDLKNKKIVITGCLAKTETRLLKKKYGCPLIGCDNIFEIVEACSGKIKESLSSKYCEKVNIVPISKNKIIEIIPICSGCVGDCSYCETKFARGRLLSYPESSIISHFKKALKKGAVEFWITAQDTGAYGLDTNSSIIHLLDELVKIPDFFKIRLGMMNPEHAVKFKKELARLLNNPKLFRFVHIPVQSGSDKILKRMKRRYNAKDFISVIDYLRKKVKGLSVATDFIIGFPGETDKDFNATIEMFKKVSPEVVNISRFWKMRNAEAGLLDLQVSTSVMKERVKKMMKLHRDNVMRNSKQMMNKFFNVLVDEKGFARTDSYKKVIVKRGLGGYKRVEIINLLNSCPVGKEL